jgi:hypothetical protein
MDGWMDEMKDLLIYCLQLIKMYRSDSFIHFFLNIFQYEIREFKC